MRDSLGCYAVLVLIVLQQMLLHMPLAHARGLPDTIESVLPSIVGVGTAYPPRQPVKGVERLVYKGTGFVVGNGNQVVTNLHVLAAELDTDNRQMHAVFVGTGTAARARGAKVLKRDEAHDLVLLEFGGPPLPALSLAEGDYVRQGQEIALTGFPIGMALGLYPVTHRGIISAITPMAQPVSESGRLTAMQVKRQRAGYMAYQLDAVAYPGNSGSPVYDADTAEVIGVLNSVLVRETRESMITSPSGISYAIPVRHLRELLVGVQ